MKNNCEFYYEIERKGRMKESMKHVLAILRSLTEGCKG